MTQSIGFKVPAVLDIDTGYHKVFPDYLGFFKDLPTVATIEEGLKSFDDLEAQRKERRKPRNFQYK